VSKFSSWRVASWGFKISNIQPELSATGRLILAPIPIGDTIPNYSQLSNAAYSTIFNSITGITYQACNSNALLNLPGAMVLVLSDLLHGDIQVAGMYTSPSFFDFKTNLSSGIDGATSLFGDSASTSTSSGASTNQAFKDLTRANGGVAWAIYWEGAPASTPNLFSLEIIMHLEGCTDITSNSGNILVPSIQPTSCPGSTSKVEKGISAVGTVQKAIKFLTKGAMFLDNNKKDIASTAATMYNVARYFI